MAGLHSRGLTVAMVVESAGIVLGDVRAHSVGDADVRPDQRVASSTRGCWRRIDLRP
ncbi:MAG TPA: hypothetical protein VG452_10840 [Egibacteraceae bacterium]|nr:hypothetical protein [Actinomycetota bacterium]HWB72703.1 hypothetical protein [Egibacteraceae bacterium]